MLSFKFKLTFLFLIFSTSSFALEGFSSIECLNSTFNTEVSHRGQPFGLTQNKILIQKEKCLITINRERLKFLKNEWHIDVCRSPVHLKTGAGAVKVLRREQNCESEEYTSDFCREIADLKRVLEDDGLIFAEGEKENLNDAHGRVTCVVSLLHDYLHQGLVLSRVGEWPTTKKVRPAKNIIVEEDDEEIEVLDSFESDFEPTL
jgi:hypothetical protein